MPDLNLFVIKIGGNIIDNPDASAVFLKDFSGLSGGKILIHGGGKVATQTAARLGIETRMVEGRRITDQAMLDVVTMVYGGLVNKRLVAALQALGVNAIGLTGADAGVIRAIKRPVKTIDYGFAGDITSVDHQMLSAFIGQNLVPVLAPLTFSLKGELLNTNADTIASASAVALSSAFDVTLIYCFEKPGVLFDPEDDNSVIPEIDRFIFEKYKTEGVISQGMVPKLDNAFAALESGVKRVVICHAKDLPETVDGQKGTQIRL